jgi:putative transposase
MQEARGRFPLSLFNYCLMTNHVHLLFKVGRHDTLSKAMHWISSTFSRRFNRQAERHGHLWEKRFRSTIIEEDRYFLRCMAYIDLNPVRAKMCVTPIEYRWCGHKALRDENYAELDFHGAYLEGATSATERYRTYMSVLEDEARRPPLSLADDYFVGTKSFVARMEKRFGLRERQDRLVRSTVAADDGAPVIRVTPKLGRARLSKSD